MSPEPDKEASEAEESSECVFRYSFPTCTREDVLFHLEAPIRVPMSAPAARELVQRLINMFHIPVFMEEDMNEQLSRFVAEETRRYHCERDAALIEELRAGQTDIDEVVRNWERLYKEHITEFAEQKGTADDEVFAAAYHRLVHSPALETILQVESSYASTVQRTLRSRDSDIEKLTQRQTEEMEEKIRTLNTFTTEDEINALAGKHFEAQSMVAGRWGSQLDALCQTQRTQYRAWLMQTLEEQQTNSALNTPSNSPLGTFSTMVPPAGAPPPPPTAAPTLEESFTIHLGSQLKQTHNVRIVCADPLRLCRPDTHDDATDASRRLQTALALYSGDLCGLVLLAESPPSRPAGVTSQFLKMCRESTECHFPDVDEQLRRIVEEVKEPVEKRNAQRFKQQSECRYGEPAATARGGRRRECSNLQTGDVFVTRHSNLPELHVAFHMVVDESSLRSGDINSRHLAILGLRNILKAACSNDITTLTLPVLLRHDMSDEMTVAWCVRRAELVLKCVKGFMMETATWGGAELKNVVFVAPEALSGEVFRALAVLLPTIFRVSSPLKFKAVA